MKTWFGEYENNSLCIKGNKIDELARWAESSDSRDISSKVDMEALARRCGLCGSPEEYRLMLHRTAMEVARDTVSRSLAGKDAYLIQAVKALDDVNGSYNVLSERLSEWYGIHFPELKLRPQELISFVLQYGRKESSGEPRASASIGAPMSAEDIEAVKSLATAVKTLFDERRKLEAYINSDMEEHAPNLSKVAGPVLGARLIARAGGLGKLAMMPASSIQVMGAGEALFKHLRSGTPSPKHGLIYKHPLISGSPKAARGKIARMLAAKVAIASRMDYYAGGTMDVSDLTEKAARIKGSVKRRKKA